VRVFVILFETLRSAYISWNHWGTCRVFTLTGSNVAEIDRTQDNTIIAAVNNVIIGGSQNVYRKWEHSVRWQVFGSRNRTRRSIPYVSTRRSNIKFFHKKLSTDGQVHNSSSVQSNYSRNVTADSRPIQELCLERFRFACRRCIN